MAGVLRRLVTEVVVRADKALSGLKAYDNAWKALDTTVAKAADSVAKNAAKAGEALAGMSAAAAGMPRGGGGGGRPRVPDPSKEMEKVAKATAKAAERARTLEAKAGERAVAARERLASRAQKAAERQAAAEVKAAAKIVAAQDRAAAKANDKAMAGGYGASNKFKTGAGRGRGELEKELGGGSTRKLGDDLGYVAEQGGKAAKGIGVAGVALGNLAAKAVAWGAGKIVDTLKSATNQAVEFETALTDIAKVTRGADDTEEGFQRIKAGITEASKELGRMPKEIAELTAQLAPVFTEGKADLVELSKDVTKIGVAWGLSGADAGKFFADISRGLDLTADQTKLLFGSINELSNKIGVNAGTVAEAVQRSAGVLKAAGLSAETGAALNATLIAAGASAEVAATGVRTFVSRLEAGAAATPKQAAAFQKLGFDAVEVGRNMSKGGKQAEEEIKKVVVALGALPKENQLPTLIELFGSESIGSIGAAATAVDTLSQSFKIAGDSTAAALSVQTEYEKVTKTSAFAIDKLKANISVLAIQFGEALLPYINKISEFLTSPEGQDWGREAVAKAVVVVTALADTFVMLVGLITNVTDTLGGTNVALIALGVAASALIGPFGLALAAGVAAGAGIAKAFAMASDAIGGTTHLLDAAEALRVKMMGQKLEEIKKAGQAEDQVTMDRERREYLARKAGVELEADVVKKAGVKNIGELDEATRLSLITRQSKLGIAASSGQGFDDELAAVQGQSSNLRGFSGGGSSGGGSSSNDEVRFAELSKKVAKGEKLRPSEGKEYTKLSKKLDLAKETRHGKGAKGPEKFASDAQTPEERQARFLELGKMGKGRKPSEDREYNRLSKDLDQDKLGKKDLQLASLDPSLSGILKDPTTGGVHDDPLSKGVFGAATGSKKHLGGIDSSLGSVGSGPNITSNYDYRTINTTITQNIPVNGSQSSAQNLASAGMKVAQMTGDVVLKGAEKILAARNGGGVLRG